MNTVTDTNGECKQAKYEQFRESFIWCAIHCFNKMKKFYDEKETANDCEQSVYDFFISLCKSEEPNEQSKENTDSIRKIDFYNGFFSNISNTQNISTDIKELYEAAKEKNNGKEDFRNPAHLKNVIEYLFLFCNKSADIIPSDLKNIKAIQRKVQELLCIEYESCLLSIIQALSIFYFGYNKDLGFFRSAKKYPIFSEPFDSTIKRINEELKKIQTNDDFIICFISFLYSDLLFCSLNDYTDFINSDGTKNWEGFLEFFESKKDSKQGNDIIGKLKDYSAYRFAKAMNRIDLAGDILEEIKSYPEISLYGGIAKGEIKYNKIITPIGSDTIINKLKTALRYRYTIKKGKANKEKHSSINEYDFKKLIGEYINKKHIPIELIIDAIEQLKSFYVKHYYDSEKKDDDEFYSQAYDYIDALFPEEENWNDILKNITNEFE